MVRALYYYTMELVKSQERVQESKQILKSALRTGRDTAPLAKDFATAEHFFAKDKEWFGEAAGWQEHFAMLGSNNCLMRVPCHAVLLT